jgi:1-acyl-sn-glycerol-3-phosphate acyltransferase
VRKKLKLNWATFVPSFYWSMTYLLRAILVVVGRWKATGRENVPRTGPVILVSNHLSNTDPPILGAGIASRRIRFMAKEELFHGHFSVITKLWGAFPVKRFDADVGALMNAERILRRGEVLGMFPEGHRSRTGYMGPVHPGTALIALRSGATVVPCAMTGTEALKNPAVLLKKPRIAVTIGQPMTIEAVRRPSEAQVSELTNRIVNAIQAMLPPRYVAPYTESGEATVTTNGTNPPGS